MESNGTFMHHGERKGPVICGRKAHVCPSALASEVVAVQSQGMWRSQQAVHMCEMSLLGVGSLLVLG